MIYDFRKNIKAFLFFWIILIVFFSNFNINAEAAESTFRITQSLYGVNVPTQNLATSSSPTSFAIDYNIYDLNISPNANSVVITWRTKNDSKAVIKWGKTEDFEGGFIQEQSFSKEHRTIISGLDEKTKYFASIFFESANNSTHFSPILHFETDALLKYIPLPNAENFRANDNFANGISGNIYINLNWSAVNFSEFDRFRVVRSTKHFPVDIYDGKIIYEGVGTDVKDTDIAPGQRYFYTIFSISKDGKYSSGAVVEVLADGRKEINNEYWPGAENCLSTLNSENLKKYENGEKIQPKNDIFYVKKGSIISFELKSECFSPESTNITIKVTKNWGKLEKSTYILQLKNDKIMYEASIIFNELGQYKIGVYAYDGKWKPLEKKDDLLTVQVTDSDSVKTLEIQQTEPWIVIVTLIFLIIFLILLLIVLKIIVDKHRE